MLPGLQELSDIFFAIVILAHDCPDLFVELGWRCDRLQFNRLTALAGTGFGARFAVTGIGIFASRFRLVVQRLAGNQAQARDEADARTDCDGREFSESTLEPGLLQVAALSPESLVAVFQFTSPLKIA